VQEHVLKESKWV